jgi:thiol-disulfide isomerase/thioredoxin
MRSTAMIGHLRFRGSCLLLLGLTLASTQATNRAGEPAVVSGQAEPIPEIPAVAYVTLMLVRDPAVQAELRLDRAQMDEVSAAVLEVDQPLWVLRDVPLAKSTPQLDALLAKFRKRLSGTLTPAQIARLDEIVLQGRGYKALVSPELSRRLQLTAQQIKQLSQALSAAKPEAPAASKKILDVLSYEQQSALTAMVGKPFDVGRVRRVHCVAPELGGVSAWINTKPLTLSELRGKVVVVHFWAFGCINCVHNQPHYQAWFEKFPESKLTIIGIHTPETDRERSVDNLRGNITERAIAYPVAVDSDAANWKAWGNNVWPSVYLIDKQGRIRAWWYGELNWQGARGEEAMRKQIQELLAERIEG